MMAPSELPLSDWNWAVLMLNQALVGAISPNFRMVELTFGGSGWVLRVTLGEDRADDREAIKDIGEDMSCYFMDLQDRITKAADACVIADVIISKVPIVMTPNHPGRVVFLMREA